MLRVTNQYLNTPMKFRILFTVISLGLLPMLSVAQDSSNSLNDQFNQVMESSNRYQEYKVIKVAKLNDFQKSMNDSLNALQKTIQENDAVTSNLQSRIDSLTQGSNKLSEELALSQKRENGITLFGAIINKSLYQTIVWSIIGILILLVLFFAYKFKNSNAITKEANSRLAETEAEFDSHRQRSLEREQQLRRKLQDEINRQKD